MVYNLQGQRMNGIMVITWFNSFVSPKSASPHLKTIIILNYILVLLLLKNETI